MHENFACFSNTGKMCVNAYFFLWRRSDQFIWEVPRPPGSKIQGVSLLQVRLSACQEKIKPSALFLTQPCDFSVQTEPSSPLSKKS